MKSIPERLRYLLRIKFVRDTAILQVGTVLNMGATLLTSMVTFRGLTPAGYGLYQLAVALYGMLLALNLTGLSLSTTVRLAAALAHDDGPNVLDLMGFYVKMAAGVALSGFTLALLLAPSLSRLMYGDVAAGDLARWLALLLALDPIHGLLGLVLQSKREMARLTVLGVLITMVNLGLVSAAVLGAHGPGGVVMARLIASGLLAIFAIVYYACCRAHISPALPAPLAVLRRAARVPVKPYLRFGFSIALDKNLGNLFALLPVQMLGSLHGEAAAGYLALGQKALSMPALLFNAAMRNLGTKLSQDAGHEDYAAMQRNFWRVTGVLAAGGVGVYGLFALLAPWLLPLLYGEEAAPAVPLVGALAVSGVVTATGGSMGALYRALERLDRAIFAKLAALALLALPGWWLVRIHGALGAAWALAAFMALSVGLTMLGTLSYLHRLADDQNHS